MLTYTPIAEMYPGDEKMRVVTRLPLVRRKPKEGVTVDVLKSLLRGGRKSCGCGDLDALCHHIESVKQLKNGQACEWCGEKAYQVCTVGLDKDGKPVPLHFNSGEAWFLQVFLSLPQ